MYGPVAMPGYAWRRPDVRAALEKRDTATLLRLIQRHTGASQARLAAAIGIGQPRMNEIINGKRQVTRLEVLERLAAGVAMPDEARVLYGLAPVHPAGHAEVTAIYGSRAEANDEMREHAAAAARIDVLAARGLRLIAMHDSLLNGTLARRRTPVEVRVLLLDPASPAAVARAAEIGESAESFTAGSQLAVARLAEFGDHPYVTLKCGVYSLLPAWRMVAFDGVTYLAAYGAGSRRSGMYRLAAAGGGMLHAGFLRQFEGMWRTSRDLL